MSISPIIIATNTVRAVFFPFSDRIAHRIESGSGDQWRPDWHSIEGNENQPWPPSPVLQTMHREQRPTGDVLLLVGMGGASHWSASVAADPQGGLDFDIACRVSAPQEWLGSSYRAISPDAAQFPGLPRAACVAVDGQLQALPTDHLSIVPLLDLQDSPSPPRFPRTFRWRYRFRVELPFR